MTLLKFIFWLKQHKWNYSGIFTTISEW